MIEIPLTKCKVALIDEDDFNLVGNLRWCASQNGQNWYAMRALPRNGRRQLHQRMHHLILGKSLIDHINGNGLDNRRENLRIASNRENCFNQRKRAGSSTYKGVCFDIESDKWLVQIQVNGKRKKIGRFKNEVEAALAWDEAARLYYKEFAALNFPRAWERSAL